MSKIFTKSELREIERFKQGNRKDPNGTFAGRVKPKIKELLEVWKPRLKELEQLIKRSNR